MLRAFALKFLLLTALIIGFSLPTSPVVYASAVLIHQYDFNGNLNDTMGTGISLTVHPNTATSGFNTGEWWWTATGRPGGGLILETNLITDPQNYSLGFRVKFNEVGPSWRKIVSFKGASSDRGLYFYGSHLQFYPFGDNAAITYSPNTFYDFIFSRSSDDVIRVYVVQEDGSVTKVYEAADSGDESVPIQVSGKYQFMFFMDDTATTSEWTTGGAVRSIRVWNGPLEEEEVGDALSDASTGAATDITTGSATLNGTVNPNGSSTTVTFEYGLTALYGTEVAADQSPVSGTTNVAVSKSINGLSPDTLCHYRVKAVNGGGTTYGSDRTFTTASIPTHNTPAGSNVIVPLSGVVVTFTTVTAEGDTGDTTETAPCGSLPYGFIARGTTHHITTTATYAGPVTVGISYNSSGIPTEDDMRLFHCDGSSWHDITTSVDTVNNIIYGQDSTLSWWWIGDPPAPGGGGVPVFPNIYIGIAAALGAGVLAYFVRRRLIHQL
jgi:hypothetical protein